MLPPGENTEDHRRLQQQEANAIEQDKGRGFSVGQGLFGGRFRVTVPRHVPVIRDEEDGVERCPQCMWELEDGVCERCGYGTSDEDDGSFMDDEPLVERAIAEHMDFYGMPDGYIDDDISLDNVTEELDHEHPGLYPYEAYYEDPYEAPFQGRAQRVLERVGARRVNSEQNGSVRRRPRLPPSLSPGDDFDDPEGQASDTESYDSEDDDAGSLDDFIEDDAHDRPVSPTVSLHSQHETDNETAAALGYDTDGSNEGFSPLRDHDDAHTGESSRNIQDGSEDESEALLHGRRRRQRHMRVLSDDDEDNGSGDSNSVVTHDSYISARNGAGIYPHNVDDLPARLGSQAGSSQRAPIEVDSDSEPVQMPRPQRRRLAVDHHSSGDTATSRSHRPRSSATFRQGQQPWVDDRGTGPSIPRGLNPSFPIALDSSPVRTTLASGRDNPNSVRSSTFTNRSRHHHSRSGVPQSVQDFSDSGSLLSEPETEPRPTIMDVRSRGSPPHRRVTPSSPRSRLPADGPNPAGRVRYQVSPNQRAFSKAQRRLAKRERRRRVREQAHNVAQGSE